MIFKVSAPTGAWKLINCFYLIQLHKLSKYVFIFDK